VIHRHYDADGNLTGTTEIVSPWDDDARNEAEALWEADRLICGICGNLREECGDPESAWYPQRHICYAKRQQETADRKYGELHKDKPFHDGTEKRWADAATPKVPFHFRDGVRVYVAPVDLHPDDNFLT
jgi:hypothetical protein